MQDYRTQVQELMKQPSNCVCADCKREKSEWASSNLGVFLCIKCSGFHRSLGTHISFIRSCTLDSWTKEQYEFMAKIGNKNANEYWEANLPSDFLYPQLTDIKGLELFVKEKYQQRKWAATDKPQPGAEGQEPVKAKQYSIRKRTRNTAGKSSGPKPVRK